MYWKRKRLFTIRQWQEKKEKKKTRNKKQNHEKLKQHNNLEFVSVEVYSIKKVQIGVWVTGRRFYDWWWC